MRQRHRVVYVERDPGSRAGTAVLIEVVGALFQCFGFGQLYTGNVAIGLVFLFGYWFLLAVNVALCFVLVGFVTGPLTWVACLIVAVAFAKATARRR